MPHFVICVWLAFKCYNCPNGYNNSKASCHASCNAFSSQFPTAAWRYLYGIEIFWDKQTFRPLKVHEERDVITSIKETWETTHIHNILVFKKYMAYIAYGLNKKLWYCWLFDFFFLLYFHFNHIWLVFPGHTLGRSVMYDTNIYYTVVLYVTPTPAY